MSTMKPKLFQFKFDDTRLSLQYKNKIGPIIAIIIAYNVAKSLPCWLWDSQQGRDFATPGQNKKKMIGPSLVSSNFNSKLFQFHCVRPSRHTYWSYSPFKVAKLFHTIHRLKVSLDKAKEFHLHIFQFCTHIKAKNMCGL